MNILTITCWSHTISYHLFSRSGGGLLASGDSRCALSLEIETYRLRKYIGAYLAVVGMLDAIVFTAGSGAPEWLVREKALSGLDCFGVSLDHERNRTIRSRQEEAEVTGTGSRVRTFVIPTNEELVIAEDVAAVCAGDACDCQQYGYSFAASGFVPFGSAA